MSYSWDQLYTPQDAFTRTQIEQSSSISSDYGESPQSVSMPLAGGPSPFPTQPAQAPQSLPAPQSMPTPHFDLQFLNQQFPGLYRQLQHKPRVAQRLQEIVSYLNQGICPEDRYFREFITARNSVYCCVLPECNRHGHGYDREDRARDHFLSSHLGRFYQCPNWCVITHIVHLFTLILRFN